jgi:signal peptidase I
MSSRTIRILAVLVAVAFCGCTEEALMPSSSMAPTIKPGSKIKIDRRAYASEAPKRWDVICFAPPMYTNQIWIMRVVALPGETVSFGTNGVLVNSQALSVPRRIKDVEYIAADHPALRALHGSITYPYTVPNGSYFVLGDNSTNALDSRFWGAINRTSVLGKVRGI